MSDIDSMSIKELCQRAEQLAEEADKKTPDEDKKLSAKEASEQLDLLGPAKKTRARKAKNKGYVVGGAVFQTTDPTVLASTEMKAGSAHVDGFTPSSKEENSAVPCGKKGNYKYPPGLENIYKGHVEAKFIEKVFSDAQSSLLFGGTKPDLPKGKLFIKLKGWTRKDKDKPQPCEESCQKLIECANQIEGFEVIICKD
jgi:hypothetical protein